jgi:hypothetical protein
MTAKATRTRAGGEKRGNSYDRAARRRWLLSPAAGHDYGHGWIAFDGNGTKVPCIHCEAMLDDSTVEADRIIPGGSYRRDNVQPACRQCNLSRSNNLSWAGPSAGR